MRLIPTAEEEKEMKEIAKMLRELSKKAHERAVDLTRRISVLQMELGEREATGQPVEDLRAEMEEIERKIEKLAALRNRAHGAANEADEFWDKWLREKRQLTGESERAGKYDSSTEKLYRLVEKLIEEGGIREDEEWWEEVLEFVDDDWVSRYSGLVIWKAIRALRLAKLRLSLWEADSGEWLMGNESSRLQKQFLGEEEEERQWIRKRALDKIRSAKDFLQWLNEGLLEDIIHNKLRDMVSGIDTDLSDLRDNIEQARELLVHLELHMEKEKPDVEMVEALCERLRGLLGPLQDRIRGVLQEAARQVEEVRERTKLPSLGKEGLSRIETILRVLEEVVDKIPEYAKELRKPIRKPRAPKIKPRFGWLP